MRYFKVVYGFGQDNFIPIDETELEKAIYAFLSEKKIILKNGAVVGSQITKIVPDYHKTMGWNYGHKMGTEDWDEVKGKCGNFEGLITAARERVNGFIQSGQTNLIGTMPLEIPKRPALKSIAEVLDAKPN